jgi:hypothetical protein
MMMMMMMMMMIMMINDDDHHDDDHDDDDMTKVMLLLFFIIALGKFSKIPYLSLLCSTLLNLTLLYSSLHSFFYHIYCTILNSTTPFSTLLCSVDYPDQH